MFCPDVSPAVASCEICDLAASWEISVTPLGGIDDNLGEEKKSKLENYKS
jgi:hypothetical protein